MAAGADWEVEILGETFPLDDDLGILHVELVRGAHVAGSFEGSHSDIKANDDPASVSTAHWYALESVGDGSIDTDCGKIDVDDAPDQYVICSAEVKHSNSILPSGTVIFRGTAMGGQPVCD
jgi:hypothetical protein